MLLVRDIANPSPDDPFSRLTHPALFLPLQVRDIANPSPDDPFFPTFRHKDWFLGFSWASGVVTIEGNPYPNGRNEESSSESIFGYEAVALYGEVAATLFEGATDPESTRKVDAMLRLRDMGRLLMATEVVYPGTAVGGMRLFYFGFYVVFVFFPSSLPSLSHRARALSLTARSLSPLSLFQRSLSLSLSLAQVRSAKTYWHVMSTETSLLHGTQRIYPEVRTPI